MALLLTAVGSSLGVAMPAANSPQVTSTYVTMRDGTRLAVDIWKPAETRPGLRFPTIVQFTRYWRAFARNQATLDPETSPTIAYFIAAGYAVAIVDVRGTGASFGSRETEFSDAEVADYGDVIDWISKEPWSNGRVATLGTSYAGNAAELAAAAGSPALRALVPRFSDFSEYQHSVRPGGILNAVIAKAWVAFTADLDRNDACAAFGGPCSPGADLVNGVEPVAGDERLLSAAIAEHANNADLASIVDRLIYSDDSFDRSMDRHITLDYVSPSQRWRAIDKPVVPAFHWASWFDGGTAAGVLTRFVNYRNPINVIIGAWNHGGSSNANPFAGRQGDDPPIPPVREQFDEIKSFLDPLLQPEQNARPVKMGVIRYMTIGTNEWHTTGVWPPSGMNLQRWYFSADNSLSTKPPRSISGFDRYRVDFAATTGTHNRWHTQLGTGVQYSDRRAADERLLAYTSAPFGFATEITGSPVVFIRMTSSSPDGALFVYLEDVAPDGLITYLTEGEIRLLFSGEGSAAAGGYGQLGPVHFFTRAEGHPVKAGKITTFAFALNPISVVIASGHRVRIAIAGADADTFERIPANGTIPAFDIQTNQAHVSYVEFPTKRLRAAP